MVAYMVRAGIWKHGVSIKMGLKNLVKLLTSSKMFVTP